MAATPIYMSPEAIQLPNSVDACSDIYAVGAVGYFLLTGRPVFEADDFGELCRLQTSELPTTPSARLGKLIPADLESAILACLEKARSKRPQTARDLSGILNQCQAASLWSVDEADAWWERHERGQFTQPSAEQTNSPNAFDATINPQ